MEIIKKSKRYNYVYQYKIKSGNFWGYRYTYYDFNKKRREITRNGFNSEREAFQHLVEVQNDINNNEITDDSITVAEWYQYHIDINKSNADGRNGNWSRNTLINRQSVLDYYIKPTIGHVKLSRLTLSLYQSEYIEFLKTKLSANTVKLYHRFMVIALNAAVKHKKIKENPILNATLPNDRDVKKDKFISVEELKTITDYVEQKENITNLTGYMTLLYTGMRVGELRALKWKNIDFDTNMIQVYASYSNQVYSLTKGKNKRIIPVDESLIELLKSYKKWCVKRRSGMLSEEDYVFISEQTGKIIASTHFYQVMKRITKATGIKVSPHTLRHTHSALLISQNQPLKAIAKRLGNTEQVLSEHYGHVIDSVDQSVMESFNDALNSVAKPVAKPKVRHIK